MKVIAVDNNDKCIIESSYDEIANLIGYHSKWDDKFKLRDLIGKEIPISKMYKQLRLLKENQSELSSVQRILEAVSNSLQIIEPIIVDIASKGDDEVCQPVEAAVQK